MIDAVVVIVVSAMTTVIVSAVRWHSVEQRYYRRQVKVIQAVQSAWPAALAAALGKPSPTGRPEFSCRERPLGLRCALPDTHDGAHLVDPAEIEAAGFEQPPF